MLFSSRQLAALPPRRSNDRRPAKPIGRQRQDPLLLVLRQEPARGPQADRRPVGVHLRRVRRALQRHHPRGARGKGRRRAQSSPEAEGNPRRARSVRDRAEPRQEGARRRRLQPLQAVRDARPQRGSRARQVEHPARRSDRLGQDAARRHARASARTCRSRSPTRRR